MTHSPHRLRSKAISWAAKFAEMQEEQTGRPEEGFYTTVEWAEKIHRSTPQASRLLRNAIRDGAAEMRVYKVQVGRWKRPVPHYRLIQPVRSKRGCSGTAS